MNIEFIFETYNITNSLIIIAYYIAHTSLNTNNISFAK